MREWGYWYFDERAERWRWRCLVGERTHIEAK